MKIRVNYYGRCGELPTTMDGYDSIWVIMDRLTKSSHFILIKVKYMVDNLARICISQIVKLYRVPVSIVLD